MNSAQVLATVRENLSRVHERIVRAADRSGRSADQIKLVAVTKYAPLQAIPALIELGERNLGENRPQQLIARAMEFTAPSTDNPLLWHLIGQLQRNKVRAVLPFVELIHSVDSLNLLQRISQLAQELGLTPRLLLQVNVSHEVSKSGFPADELRRQWDQVVQVPQVRLAGLMTMAPLTDDTDIVRSTFRGLRELQQELYALTPEIPLTELSMGMSQDFEIAIEEGATLVRLGSALFEGIDS